MPAYDTNITVLHYQCSVLATPTFDLAEICAPVSPLHVRDKATQIE